MKILLGYEVGTGVEVYLEDGQTVVTGMTQLSGKTTALEALVTRGEITAVAFLTKRGESGFRNQREIRPYFKEQKRGELIDWQYVSAILEAVMSEKMKLERSFIINACKGARSLQEVYENIKRMKEKTRRGFDESIYTNLEAYFEIIIPQIKKYKFADKLELRKGFNVLNLIGMEEEMQQLVIESVLSYVYEKMKNVIIVIPEAHKFIPQGLKTPVKGTALRLIKEGAAIGNYMWIDTQETTSTDKALLKQCSNWIMGYQQEKNEVKNVRENIGRRKITEEDIMNLKLGHFIASLHQKIYHVYVLPAGIDPEIGRNVAMGKIPVQTVKEMIKQEDNKFIFMDDEPMDSEELQLGISPEEVAELQRTVDGLETRSQGLQDEVDELTLRTEGIVARNKMLKEEKDKLMGLVAGQEEEIKGLRMDKEELEADKSQLMRTIERQGAELSQFKAFRILLARIISPYIEIPDITEEQFKAMEKQIEDLKKVPRAPRRRSIPPEGAGDTGIAWIDIWLQKVGPAEQKILIFMASRFPMKMTKAEIATGCGLTTTGGYFNGAFNKLRRNKLVIEEGKNTWKLAEVPP